MTDPRLKPSPAEFVTAAMPRVLGFLRSSRFVRRCDIEDYAQEAAVALLRLAATYDPSIASIASIAKSVAHFIAMNRNYKRRQRRMLDLAGVNEPSRLPDEPADLEPLVRLTPDEAMFFRVVVVGGYRAAGKLAGISEGAARNRAGRIRARVAG